MEITSYYHNPEQDNLKQVQGLVEPVVGAELGRATNLEGPRGRSNGALSPNYGI